ncbi:MAG: hypothetical protein ABSE15_00765 [Candidatus Bathyarchaeia archaeon]
MSRPKFLTNDVALDLGIILVVGFLSITWFRGNFLIKSGDSFFGLSPNFQLTSNSYIWNPVVGSYAQEIGGLPYYLFMTFLGNIGVPLIVSEKMLFYFLFTFSGLSMYYLSTVLMGNHQKRLIGLISALFYMMNSFTLINIWGNIIDFSTLVFAYALLPVSLGLFIKGLNTKNFRYLFFILIAWLIGSVAWLNPAFMIPIVIVLFLYMSFFIMIERKNKAKIIFALKFCFILLLIWLFLNLFWILPAVSLIAQEYGTAQLSGSYLSVFIGTSSTASIMNNLRLVGYGTLYSNFLGDPYFTWSGVYLSNPFFIIMSFLIPILAFLALLFNQKDKYTFSLVSLAIIDIFVMKGAHSPFGELNLWLFQNVPFAGIFRNSYEKFAMIIPMCYAFLIGSSVWYLYDHLKKYLISFGDNQ